LKVVKWLGKSSPADVLEEHEDGLAVADDAADVRPEPSLVVGAFSFAGGGEWLARESRSDEIHASAPRCAVEGGKIRPTRRVIQGTRFTRCSQVLGAECFPLHTTDRANVGEHHAESELESSDAGAEVEHVDGRCSHTSHLLTVVGRARRGLLRDGRCALASPDL
jgi:hypothetical protein